MTPPHQSGTKLLINNLLHSATISNFDIYTQLFSKNVCKYFHSKRKVHRRLINHVQVLSLQTWLRFTVLYVYKTKRSQRADNKIIKWWQSERVSPNHRAKLSNSAARPLQWRSVTLSLSVERHYFFPIDIVPKCCVGKAVYIFFSFV